MNLKDLLNQKRNAVLEEERKQQELERQRLADEAVVPHPLRGREAAWKDDYVRGQLVLRGEGKTLDSEGALLRPFAISLGIPLEHFAELEQEVSFYDEQSKGEILEMLSGALKEPDEIICFMCDMTRLHGEAYSLEGEFLELWRSVCMGVFQVGSAEMAVLELFCTQISSKSQQSQGDDYGDVPQELIQYYLYLEQGGENGQYLVIDLSAGANAERYPIRYTDEAPKAAEDTCKTSELWLRRIPAGSFTMGSPENELGHLVSEKQHQVTLTQDYYISVFPCTQRQYELVMGNNPSRFKRNDRPVETVSYDDLRGTWSEWPGDAEVDEDSFFGRLQARTGLAFDLPTETQWEYACRAGAVTSLNSGKNITSERGSCPNLDAIGWYDKNSGNTTHPVGRKKPNEWGLYDMHGNVWEWCLDWYGDYPNVAVEDPQGAKSGRCRVLRGGSWSYSARYCRSAFRCNFFKPPYLDGFGSILRYGNVGFRVALRS